MAGEDARRHAPATLRNRDAILAAIAPLLPAEGLLLEVASGSGEHAAYMAPRLPPGLIWQPSDADPQALAGIDAHAQASGAANLRPALWLDVLARPWPLPRADALLCCNMIHIAPWTAAEALFAGAAALLPAGAPLLLYGPYRRDGLPTAPSNEAFDRSLRQQDPRWGLRALDGEVVPLAAAQGFGLEEVVAMPANNLTVLFRRAA